MHRQCVKGLFYEVHNHGGDNELVNSIHNSAEVFDVHTEKVYQYLQVCHVLSTYSNCIIVACPPYMKGKEITCSLNCLRLTGLTPYAQSAVIPPHLIPPCLVPLRHSHCLPPLRPLSTQVFTACCVSFAHGSNDVANSIGPFSAIYTTYQTYAVPSGSTTTEKWIFVFGGVGIVVS